MEPDRGPATSRNLQRLCDRYTVGWLPGCPHALDQRRSCPHRHEAQDFPLRESARPPQAAKVNKTRSVPPDATQAPLGLIIFDRIANPAATSIEVTPHARRLPHVWS